jgi:hypothetical protein
MKDVYYAAVCQNPNCRILTYKWHEPGDVCPGCGWVGDTTGAVAVEEEA